MNTFSRGMRQGQNVCLFREVSQEKRDGSKRNEEGGDTLGSDEVGLGRYSVRGGRTSSGRQDAEGATFRGQQ